MTMRSLIKQYSWKLSTRIIRSILILMPFIFILGILVVGFLFSIWWRNNTWEKGAPYITSAPKVVQRIMNMAEIGKGDIFYDLGSGDGRVVIAAALRGAKAYGVEIDRLRVLYSRLWIKLLGLDKKAKIIHGDIFKENISKATVVCTYLTEETQEELKKKLKKKLKKGTKVVAVGFEYKGWKVIKIDHRRTKEGAIRLYEI